VANRDLGTVVTLEEVKMTVRMDGKAQHSVTFDAAEFRQLDHGYAVTSHSSQGLIAARVLANFDTDSSRTLINTRLAYVSISRASDDAHIYTNDAGTLGERLASSITKTAVIDFRERPNDPHLKASETNLRDIVRPLINDLEISL
jgi:ATP-dependent exoDNAse (exonuclease V) alpha subunit